MNNLIARAGRALKYRVIHRAQRYGVKHGYGWYKAEQITGATVAAVEEQINELLAPIVQQLSVERINAGFRLPENFGDQMKAYLRQEFDIIDRATGNPLMKPHLLIVVQLGMASQEGE
jgi:hypothetical protein